MASTTLNPIIATPEKVKNLLSSFIVSPDEPESSQEPSNCSPDVSNSKSPSGSSKQGDTSVNLRPRRVNSSAALRSYESYIERLDTFSSLSWFNKPAVLSPLVCARYGWVVKEADLLQCQSCDACLSAQLPSRANTELYKEALDKLKKNLYAAHDKFCLLAVKPCPESFCKVPLDDPAKLNSTFTERLNNLSNIRDRLPDLNYTQLRELGYDEGQGAAYCRKHLTSDLDPSPQAVTLAFTGWTLSSKDVLVCCMCRRQVGMWNFPPPGDLHVTPDPCDSTCPDSDDEGEGAGGKRRRLKDPVKSKFKPLEEHRLWCPWLAPCAPSSPRKHGSSPPPSSTHPPACVAAIKVVAPGLMDNNTGLAHAMKTSPMVEGLRCFRRVIKSWSSPKVNSSDVSITEVDSPEVICTSPVITPKIINQEVASPVMTTPKITNFKVTTPKLITKMQPS